MQKLYILLIFLIVGFSLFGQQSSTETFVLTKTTNNVIELSFIMPQWSLESVDVKKQKNANIIDTYSGGITMKEGSPELPFFSTSIRITHDAPEIEIFESEYVEYENVTIAPSPDMGERADEKRKRKVNVEAYATDKFFPEKLIQHSEVFIFRSEKGISLNLFPFRYNPVSKVLRVYNHIKIRVVNSGNRVVVSNTNTSYEYESLFGSLFLNPPTMESKSIDIPRMMIVAPRDYQNAVKPFVKWKNQRGIDAFVVDAEDFSNEFEIRNYVRRQYLDNGLMYLVLIGDSDRVPTFTVDNGKSDMTYAYLEGEDHFPEVFVGRISAANAYEIEKQITRFIEYEKNPFTGIDWFSNVLGIASKNGPGHNNEMDYQHIRNIQSILMDYTYRSAAECFDGSQGGLDRDGNVYTEEVINTIRDGTGVVFYTGHGEKDKWFTSGLSTDHIDNFRNENMLPLILSVACLCGDFTDGTCLGEALLNGDNDGASVGAIGAFMSSGSISWVVPMQAQDAMADIIAANNISTSFGSIAVGGCVEMNKIYFWAGEKITDTWVLFGDPSLEFRSTYPASIEVAHEKDIAWNSHRLPIKVIAKHAIATISKDGKLINSQFVQNGFVSMNVEGLLEKNQSYDLVVTAPNRIPYISTITTTENPGRVISPEPVDGANMTSLLPRFSWKGDGECENVSYRFFLGTNNPPSNILNGAALDTELYHPKIIFQQNSTYYWRVDAVFNDIVKEGEVWTFTTLPDADEDFEHFYDEGRSTAIITGNPAWIIENSNPFRGDYSAHSANLNQGNECVMEVNSHLTSEDFVGFWLQKSDGESEGLLQLLVNDEAVMEWRDPCDWMWVEYALDPGEYSLKWRYQCLTQTPNDGGAWIDDIYIPGNRTVYASAGDDITVCMDDKPAPKAYATSWTGVQWYSEGDGGFDDSNALQPYYYPGPMDLAQGHVNLTISVFNDKINTELTDSITIFFARPPDVKINVQSH